MIEKALKFVMGFRDIEVVEHDGVRYSSRPLIKFPELQPASVSTKSLASIVDLISSELDHSRISGLKIIIQVEGPTKVKVFTSLKGSLDRADLYVATAELPQVTLNNFMEIEAMTIMLKSTFVESETRDLLIKTIAGLSDEAVKTLEDDGITQRAAVKTGVQTLSKVTLNPIVKLAPYRTFLEVEQPEGEFLLRLKTGPTAALYEADGGAWKLKARQNVKQYFEESLEKLIDSGRVVVLE